MILSSVLTLTNTSDFTLAAAATIDAADELLGADATAKVEQAFMDRGLIDCQRVLPVGRVGRPDEIAHAVLFLMKNGYVTGINLLLRF